jgi:hypothetical protein
MAQAQALPLRPTWCLLGHLRGSPRLVKARRLREVRINADAPCPTGRDAPLSSCAADGDPSFQRKSHLAAPRIQFCRCGAKGRVSERGQRRARRLHQRRGLPVLRARH